MTTTDVGSRSSVWSHAGFRNLWIGLSASNLGSQVTKFALPLVAVLTLDASSSEVGVLNALGQLPYLLITLFVGVYVDRFSSRQILIVADLGRLAMVLSIPLLALTTTSTLAWLYVVTFIIGCFTVLFDVASQSYLPKIIDRSHLTAGNGALEASQAAATIAGPAVGGLLVQLLTAPVAIAAGAVAYLGSVIAVFRTPKAVEVQNSVEKSNILRRIGAGLRIVFANGILRVMAIVACVYNLFFAGYQTVNILYLTREIKLSPAAIGLVFGSLGPGLLIGAALAAWMARVLGYGRSIMLTAIGANGVVQGIAVVHGNGWTSVAALVAINVCFGVCGLSHAVLMRSIRQAMTPDNYLGRIAATNRFLAQGATPIGALLGGFLAAHLELRAALLVMTLGMLSVVFILAMSALPRIGKELPEPAAL